MYNALYVIDPQGENLPLVIVQYTFSDGVEVPIKMEPHGNSTKNKRPFYRTQSSTYQSIKENVPVMSPKEALKATYDSAGGILEMSSNSEVGRNLRQMYNAKSSQGCTSGLTSKCSKDLVYDLLEQHYLGESDFVRSVNFADSVMSVVATDQQLDDVVRFCANDSPMYGSILGIDPTFNLGDFFVTPTVYEHKMVVNRVTGKHPNFIGPCLIHQDRKFGTYHYFASEIKKLRPSMQSLMAIGTDGEEALSSAFLSVFPGSSHLQCSLHKRDNIARKLSELRCDETTSKQILADVFGSTIGDTRFEGLVDSADCADFMEKVESLKAKWESLCPGFVKWFVEHEARVICTSMIASVRSQAGLGSPPKSFTTNSNESLNNLLKRKVDFKKSEWPQFNKTLRSAVQEQQAEFEKALFGQGEYELVADFKHLEVPHSRWLQMNAQQRKEKVQKACVAKLPVSTSTKALPDALGSHKSLSVKFSDAKIDHVSQERAKSMWEKAEILLNTEGFVLPAAGAVGQARQVASLTGQQSGKREAPHNVSTQKRPVGMEVKCDCPVYHSSPNLCQHALAAAEDLDILCDYLSWVRKTKKTLNLSQLISSSVPKGAGNKPARRKGKPKQKITAVTNTVPMSSASDVRLQDSPTSSDKLDEQSASMYSPCTPNHYFTSTTPPWFSSRESGSIPPWFNFPEIGNYNNWPVPPNYQGCQFQSPLSPVTQSFGGVHSTVYNMSSAACNSTGPVFTLQWLTGTQIRKCYGCTSPIRMDTATVPPPPYDLVIRYKERRYYRDPVTQALKLTQKEENTYYHCMKLCVLNKHPAFTSNMLCIPPDVKALLSPTHKFHLYEAFEICI